MHSTIAPSTRPLVWVALLFLVMTPLLVTACGQSGATPSPSASATSLVPMATPASSMSPPAVTATATGTALASATPTPAPTRNPSALTFQVTSGTEARYRVKEQLAGRDLPNDAVGVTQTVKGAIVLGSDGQVLADR